MDKSEKIVSLSDELSLWKVPLLHFREQDKNARVMQPEKFNRLVQNIKDSGYLESLPLCVIQLRESGLKEFSIISGHHRVRAAKQAELSNIFTLVFEKKLSTSEIKAKQLAHNAINGFDDKQVLKDIYDEIISIDLKIKTGLTELELSVDIENVDIDPVEFSLDYEIINMLFLPSQFDKFDEVLNLLDNKCEKIYLTNLKDFDDFSKTIRSVSKKYKIRNISSIMLKMVDICKEHIDRENLKEKDNTSDKPKK